VVVGKVGEGKGVRERVRKWVGRGGEGWGGAGEGVVEGNSQAAVMTDGMQVEITG
jgi:hypothetical protein